MKFLRIFQRIKKPINNQVVPHGANIYYNPIVQYIKTYHGWIIIKIMDNSISPRTFTVQGYVFLAYKNQDTRPVLGVDLPDLEADIDEAER